MRTILAYMNLHYKTSLERYQQFTKIKKKFWEKVASSGFNYKERKLVLTANKLFEHNFSTRMKIIYNVKYKITLCNSFEIWRYFLNFSNKVSV